MMFCRMYPARREGSESTASRRRKVLRVARFLYAMVFELFFDAPHQFVELLWVKP